MTSKYFRAILTLNSALIGIVASSPALAQADSAASGDVGDIIVTARRTEERLQDVPISIQVVSQQELDNKNIVTGTDLALYTPSLTTNSRYGPDTASFAIRGFTQEANTAPSVGVYFADAPTTRTLGGTNQGSNLLIGAFMDLQSTQVLKGPQGTLFGRNTTGGAVLLVPNKPSDRFEGFVEGSIGNYDMRRIQAVVNIPLASNLKLRLGFDRQLRDGYMHNRSGIGPKDLNDTDYYYGRVGLVWDITPDLENYTLVHYSNSDTNGYGTRIVACSRSLLERATLGAGIFFAGPACTQLDRQTARGDGPYDVENPIPNPFFKIEQTQVINTTTWRASDSLTVKNIFSYGRMISDLSYNLNGENFRVEATGFPIAVPRAESLGLPIVSTDLYKRPGAHGTDQRAFTEELQLQGVAGALTWQAGGYLEISRSPEFNDGYAAVFISCPGGQPSNACTDPYGFGTLSNFRAKNNFTNKGLYAQGTYKLTEQLSLTAGIRYTWDEHRAIDEATRIFYPISAPLAPFMPITQRCNDFFAFPSGLPGKGKVVTDPSQCHQVFVAKSSKPTWLINLDYKPVDEVMVYAKWARGYRAGGVNSSNIGLQTWKPEKLDSYEIGLKASFHGAIRGYFNAAAFYNNFSDQQVIATLVDTTVTPATARGPTILNSGKSTIKGVEVDAGITPVEGLQLTVGYSYLDSKLKELAIPTNPSFRLDPLAQAGDPLTLTPKNRLTLGANYTVPLDDSIGKISLGVNYIYTDKQLITRQTLPQYQFLPATNLLNLNVGWTGVMGSPIDMNFFMTNVTNEKIVTVVSSTYNTLGYESEQFAAPRMYGVRIRYRFGS